MSMCEQHVGPTKRRLLCLGLLIPVIAMLCAQPVYAAPIADSPILLIRLAGCTFDPLDEAASPSLASHLRLSGYASGQLGSYLLQFQGPVRDEWRDAVISAGAKLYDYIPDYAFIVRMDATNHRRIEAFPFVRWVGVYQPAYRITPGLLATASPESDSESIPPSDGKFEARRLLGREDYLSLTVLSFPDEDVRSIAQALRNLGGSVRDVA